MPVAKNKLVSKLQQVGVKQPQRRQEPLWKGPEQDGITFSLLCRFLSCRERFRLLVVEGLRTAEAFNPRIEYGNMWHVCEEALAACAMHQKPAGTPPWQEALRKHARDQCIQYPAQQQLVDTWYRICLAQFPAYVGYWAKHPDVQQRTPVFQEKVFDIAYNLPSGRVVRLRGKFDSVDAIGTAKRCELALQENKTKSSIDDRRIVRQLTFDLQTMIYLVALTQMPDLDDYLPAFAKGKKLPLCVRYNVIKRPSHHQGKKETKEEFIARLQGIIVGDPANFFARWKVPVLPTDIAKFRRECLDPLLEQLCDWWEWVQNNPDPFGKGNEVHWRHPFGVYNVLDEGGSSDLDEYLASGSEVGLQRVDKLFNELT